MTPICLRGSLSGDGHCGERIALKLGGLERQIKREIFLLGRKETAAQAQDIASDASEASTSTPAVVVDGMRFSGPPATKEIAHKERTGAMTTSSHHIS